MPMDMDSGVRIVTAAQMRELDRRATDIYGIPSLLLMENAGRAVADTAKEMLEESGGCRVLVVAGPGNNGGDGFVAARHLHNAENYVKIAYYGDREKAKGDALTNIEIAEKMGLEILNSPHPDELRAMGLASDFIIDALLGTGVKGKLRGVIPKVIGAMNLSCRPILAVDIPSGVDADTGALLGPAVDKRHILQDVVWADVTVTFGLPKVGLLTYPGAAKVGRLIVADIGIPIAEMEELDCDVWSLGPGSAVWIAPAALDGNKGDMGHVAIIAGSVGMTGAAALSAEGALRVGTGLVTLAVPESLNDIMEVKLTEAMTIPVPEGPGRAFGKASLEKVLEIIEKRDAAVIGPGFGRNQDTIDFTLALLKKLKKPAIVDADALFAVAADLSVLKKLKAPVVITPHPGEMARLLGTTAAEVQSNRLEVARSFAQGHNVTVVLKGAGTVIAAPDGRAFINTSGTPGMATGGTGDVLSGMVGGLLAMGEEPIFAATAAVYVHGRAGEKAAEKLGASSMIASDVAANIADAIQDALHNVFEEE